MNILLVGNSYTYYNDLHGMLEKLCRANGKEVSMWAVFGGGRNLAHNVDNDDPQTRLIDRLIATERLDVCVLQEQSVLPILNYEAFAENVKRLSAKLKPATDRFVLYATWGRKEGSPELATWGWDSSTMAETLAASYKKAATICDADVAHVGLNFREIATSHPEIELYDGDMTHPSYKGTCLAALTLYRTIFGEMPTDISCLHDHEIVHGPVPLSDACFPLSDKEFEIMKDTVAQGLTV